MWVNWILLIPLDEDTKAKSAFVTPLGQYHYTVMQFGIKQFVCDFCNNNGWGSKGVYRVCKLVDWLIDDVGVYEVNLVSQFRLLEVWHWESEYTIQSHCPFWYISPIINLIDLIIFVDSTISSKLQSNCRTVEIRHS